MKLSVYLTSYNKEPFLRTAILSVINQTRVPDELIIIDDASTDLSPSIIKQFYDQYPKLIKPYFNARNQGIAKNRNLAINYCTGDYLAGIDGDDYWYPNKLLAESNAIIKFNADFSFGAHHSFTNDEELNENWDDQVDFKQYEIKELFTKTLFRKFGPSLYRSELVSTKVLRELGGYDEGLQIFEDYDLKIRLANKYQGVGTETVFQAYRNNIEGLSNQRRHIHFRALNHIFSKNKRLVPATELPKFEKFRKNILKEQLFSGVKDGSFKIFDAISLAKKSKIISPVLLKGLVKHSIYG